ncbi:putative zinc-binding peptidase [Pokkaliibacter sp. MBI-7]|uniref:zinc-binding metallopeptidase family protein n=1 Tax=Pokkaliibacter sp. MBI-7 TaxID=3040600 RepID=UPI00244CF8A4|nr:putative zinc-binding peptidase [Pokkaliibacter sp. MBI-7]MDH2434044.1 putative zinc-binding peptidase [Pokkaliibacter sp. MBI-7]
MRLFRCQSCQQTVFFENTHCEHCRAHLGFIAEHIEMTAFSAETDEEAECWRDQIPHSERMWRYCGNHAYQVCNWLVPADSDSTLCEACRLNRTIPDLGDAERLNGWRAIEMAKHRLVYALLRLRLPLLSKHEDSERGLAFDFLADAAPAFREGPGVQTGHVQGVITLNIAEADPVAREAMRQDMAEPYRTLLGHVRHESGHYYWDRLVANSQWLAPFRALFGDEQQDYAQALQQHYQQGAPLDWQQRHISAYASMHPWEDWAETWAHYLHMVDTLETAYAFGLTISPGAKPQAEPDAEVECDPYRQTDFDTLFEAWLPLTFAVNSLNRSMGQPDLYPFVISPLVASKMDFVHRVIAASAVLTKAV